MYLSSVPTHETVINLVLVWQDEYREVYVKCQRIEKAQKVFGVILQWSWPCFALRNVHTYVYENIMFGIFMTLSTADWVITLSSPIEFRWQWVTIFLREVAHYFAVGVVTRPCMMYQCSSSNPHLHSLEWNMRYWYVRTLLLWYKRVECFQAFCIMVQYIICSCVLDYYLFWTKYNSESIGMFPFASHPLRFSNQKKDQDM